MTDSPTPDNPQHMLLAQFPFVRAAQSTSQGETSAAPFGFNLGYNLGDDDSRVTANIARFAEALGLDAEISPS
jgi:copper oxidase (laccase) domain-containing protein